MRLLADSAVQGGVLCCARTGPESGLACFAHSSRAPRPQVLRRYHLQDREDYKAYNKLCGMVTKLTHLLQQLDPADEERIQMTDELLDKCATTLQSHLRRQRVLFAALSG